MRYSVLHWTSHMRGYHVRWGGRDGNCLLPVVHHGLTMRPWDQAADLLGGLETMGLLPLGPPAGLVRGATPARKRVAPSAAPSPGMPGMRAAPLAAQLAAASPSMETTHLAAVAAGRADAWKTAYEVRMRAWHGASASLHICRAIRKCASCRPCLGMPSDMDAVLCSVAQIVCVRRGGCTGCVRALGVCAQETQGLVRALQQELEAARGDNARLKVRVLERGSWQGRGRGPFSHATQPGGIAGTHALSVQGKGLRPQAVLPSL